jgi:hypothetical protein
MYRLKHHRSSSLYVSEEVDFCCEDGWSLVALVNDQLDIQLDSYFDDWLIGCLGSRLDEKHMPNFVCFAQPILCRKIWYDNSIETAKFSREMD